MRRNSRLMRIRSAGIYSYRAGRTVQASFHTFPPDEGMIMLHEAELCESCKSESLSRSPGHEFGPSI